MSFPPDSATAMFRDALVLAADNRAEEALGAFRAVAATWPSHELADDALWNVGACYLAMNDFRRAAETFDDVLRRFPKASIASAESGGRESGPTAAKALLGLVSARLGLGDVAGARAAASRLEDHPDAVVRPAPGVTRTFREIAVSLINATTSTPSEADVIGPDDVVAG